MQPQEPARSIAVRTQVRWSDCDPAGIAYYPRFFEWMDLATHALARELGIRPEEMLPPKLAGLPVGRAHAEFLRPARYADALEVRAWVTGISRRSFSLRHEIVRLGDPETLLARGREDRIYAGRDEAGALRARPIPEEMRVVLARYADGSAPGPH